VEQNSIDSREVAIRPYARLLTMLGEQLIKNDRIALVELLKNSYDADALTARVVFQGFDADLTNRVGSTVVLVDDGVGMSDHVVLNHWLNPATNLKADLKITKPRSNRGRVIQGEKGIGRFAIFKLGSTATITTRSIDEDVEHVVEYDLSFLDRPANDPTVKSRAAKPQFLDEIRVQVTTRQPVTFDGSNPDGLGCSHGTRIEVGALRSRWNQNSVRKTFDEAARLQPLVPAQGFEAPSPGNSFSVEFWQDRSELPFARDFAAELETLFDDRAVLRVHGIFSTDPAEFVLEINGEPIELALDDPQITGLRIFKKYFGARSSTEAPSDRITCGAFSFSLFVFDLSAQSPVQHRLDREQTALVKDHRIYLYRDGVRVLPYGDPDDDWLQLDVIRGTQGASKILGNDQTVGFVHISQSGNPNLRDKTNREGLLDSGDAYNDFVTILQIVLSYVRSKPYARYSESVRRRLDASKRQQADVSMELKQIEDDAALPVKFKQPLRSIELAYQMERSFLEARAERTEDLAGVGLSVEAASHDIIAAGGQALRLARTLSEYAAEKMPSNTFLGAKLRALIDLLGFVTSRLNDVQGLFVSTRQRRRSLDAGDYARRVGRMFHSALEEHGITFVVDEPEGPLFVMTTEGALLQALVNIVDNAIYWLSGSKQKREIVVRIEAKHHRLIVADTGPGVNPEDLDFIFEAFYSGKGDDGKGLGLYISRQVGARSGFRVDLLAASPVRNGANFVLDFAEILE
jgi:signal transduction histidine kinase